MKRAIAATVVITLWVVFVGWAIWDSYGFRIKLWYKYDLLPKPEKIYVDRTLNLGFSDIMSGVTIPNIEEIRITRETFPGGDPAGWKIVLRESSLGMTFKAGSLQLTKAIEMVLQGYEQEKNRARQRLQSFLGDDSGTSREGGNQ